MRFNNRPSCIYYVTKLIRIVRRGSTGSFTRFKRATKALRSFCRCTIQGKRGDKLTRFDIHNKPSDIGELQKWLTAFKALPRCPILKSNQGLNEAGLNHIDNACRQCPRRMCYEQQNAYEITAVKLEDRNF